ncbi:MAG: putative toxin-antitoxin system toxin component, PIN family [Candidatus Doudnabacteria bacterium]
MKVVLDTNVLITAFKDEYSYQKQIIDEIIAGRIEAFANNQTLRENKLILNNLIQDQSYKKELENFFSQVNSVINRKLIKIVYDPEDNKILESAVEAKADYLITEDKALLELNPFQGIKIVEPIAFWKDYEVGQGNDPWQKWIKFVSSDRH